LAVFLSREMARFYKKQDRNCYYTAWLSLTGPNEYLKVDHYSKWAELDMTPAQDPKLKEQAADLRRIGNRIIQCTRRSQRIIEEILHDLSLDSGKEVPNLIRTVRNRVRPDKINDYLALVKSEILPAVKKSGVKVYSNAQARYGALTSEFLAVFGFNKWADPDEPFGVAKGMGRKDTSDSVQDQAAPPGERIQRVPVPTRHELPAGRVRFQLRKLESSGSTHRFPAARGAIPG
jgi:hypothetical protein